jgi:hypothetical protein
MNDKSNPTLEEMASEISEMEKQLLDMKKAYREKKYEGLKIAMDTPDFVLPNGIIIETKGRFTVADRRKHLLIKKQHPKLDIRFVFENENNKLRKGSKTSYGKWCDKNDFLYCTRVIPQTWLKKRGKKTYPTLIQFRNKKI